MTTDLDGYRDDLVLALRMRDVPGDRIGEIVAEVESHVADTGESPRDAFGPPEEYAAAFPGGRRSRFDRRDAVLGVVSLATGVLFASGLLALVDGTRVGPLPAWAALGLAAALGIPAATHVRRSSSPVRDPRTGRDMARLPRWVVWVLVGVPVGILLAGVVAVAVAP